MKTFYLTFGQTHTHRVTNHTLDKDCVVKFQAATYDDARRVCFERFGPKWCFLYEEGKDWNPDHLKYFPRGIIEL